MFLGLGVGGGGVYMMMTWVLHLGTYHQLLKGHRSERWGVEADGKAVMLRAVVSRI